MFHVAFCVLLLVIYMEAVVDRLPRLGKRELIFLLLFTCNFVVSQCSGRFPLPLGAWDGLSYLIVAPLSLPYNYFDVAFWLSLVAYLQETLPTRFAFYKPCSRSYNMN